MHACRTDALEQFGCQQAGGPRIEHLDQIRMRPADGLAILAAERAQLPADPPAAGHRHGRQQPPVPRVRQSKEVLVDLGGPVPDHDAQSHVLVDNAHDPGAGSGGELGVVLSECSQFASEVGTARDLAQDLLALLAQPRITRAAQLLDLILRGSDRLHEHILPHRSTPARPPAGTENASSGAPSELVESPGERVEVVVEQVPYTVRLNVAEP
jgi:hypothetical protein